MAARRTHVPTLQTLKVMYTAQVLSTPHHHLEAVTLEQAQGAGKASGTHTPRTEEGVRDLRVPRASSQVNRWSRYLDDFLQQSLLPTTLLWPEIATVTSIPQSTMKQRFQQLPEGTKMSKGLKAHHQPGDKYTLLHENYRRTESFSNIRPCNTSPISIDQKNVTGYSLSIAKPRC